MDFTSSTLLLSLGLFAGMLGCLELGRRFGQRRRGGDADKARAGVATAEGAVFAMMGLPIAFSFSGAGARGGPRARPLEARSPRRPKARRLPAGPCPR